MWCGEVEVQSKNITNGKGDISEKPLKYQNKGTKIELQMSLGFK